MEGGEGEQRALSGPVREEGRAVGGMADDLPVRADVALAVDAPQGEGQQPLQIRGPQIGVVQQQVPQGGGACGAIAAPSRAPRTPPAPPRAPYP